MDNKYKTILKWLFGIYFVGAAAVAVYRFIIKGDKISWQPLAQFVRSIVKQFTGKNARQSITRNTRKTS